MAADAVLATGWPVRMVEGTPPRVLSLLLETHERREAKRLLAILQIVHGADPESLSRAYGRAIAPEDPGAPKDAPVRWDDALAGLMKAGGIAGAAVRIERRRRALDLLARFPSGAAA